MAEFEKTILVEYLYLDLESCDRCIGTDQVLDEIMLALTPVLNLSGLAVDYQKIEMTSAEIAEAYEFVSSPTIRVNGRDISQSLAESSCGCCSDISGTDVDCRVFEFDEETYEIPPKDSLAQAILNEVYGRKESSCSSEENAGCCSGEENQGCCSAASYELPGNLKEFFEGKLSKTKI